MFKTGSTQPSSSLSFSTNTSQAKEKMGQPLFEQLLNLYQTMNVSGQFRHYDMSEVLPDTESLRTALQRIPTRYRATFLSTVGGEHLNALLTPPGAFSGLLRALDDDATAFLRDLKYVTAISDYIDSEDTLIHLIRVFPLERGDKRLLSRLLTPERLNKFIASQDALLRVLAALDNSPRVWRLITGEHRMQLIPGEDGLSDFLSRYKGDADALIRMIPSLEPHQIGNVRSVLERVQRKTSRQSVIQILADRPDQLAEFDDEELYVILNELSTDQFNTFLGRCFESLTQRPELMQRLAETRLDNIQALDVFMRHYIAMIPPGLWKAQWQVIVNQLLSDPARKVNLFLGLGEASTKDVLDLYEMMTNTLRNTIASHQYAENWVDGLLWLQGGWRILGKIVEDDERQHPDDRSIHTGLAIVLVLPFALAISIIGLIPALIAGIVHLASVKPLQAEIDQQTAGFPGQEPAQILAGYDDVRDYHTTLKQRFFGRSSSGQDETTPLLDVDDLSPGLR